MDKLNEMLIGTLAVMGAFITKRVFNNHDTLSERVTALEKVVLTKEDLNTIERNVDIIVTHLITAKYDNKND